MGKKTTYQDLNPKAVSGNELFGYINPQTREWKVQQRLHMMFKRFVPLLFCARACVFVGRSVLRIMRDFANHRAPTQVDHSRRRY